MVLNSLDNNIQTTTKQITNKELRKCKKYSCTFFDLSTVLIKVKVDKKEIMNNREEKLEDKKIIKVKIINLYKKNTNQNQSTQSTHVR